MPRSYRRSRSRSPMSSKHKSHSYNKNSRSSSEEDKYYRHSKLESSERKKSESKSSKHKRYKHRDSSSSSVSSTDSSSSDKSIKLLEKLKAERLKAVEHRQRQKELMKANETPEEKRICAVKKRRLEREQERQNREEEMQMMQRSKEAAQFEEWERQEDKFHLEQARLRSHIRIQDGRAKPIDLLAKYISAEEEVDAVEMHEPYTYLNGLQIKDLEDLIEDIKVYQELERGKNLDYWNDITVIVEDELQKLRKLQQQNDFDTGINRREGIHQSVATDVTQVFKGKTTAQLKALQSQIDKKIHGKADGIDIGYWESLSSQLKAHMARARLRDRHQENLRRKLQVLKAEQAVAASNTDNNEPEPAPASTSTNTQVVTLESEPQPGGSKMSEEETTNSDKEMEYEDPEVALLNECFASYENGNYSPRFLSPEELEPGTIVVNEEDELKRLEFARAQVINSGKKVENVMTKEELMLQREARKGMGEDEAQFSVEAALDSQVYLWSDKYRPRKPRYFNRVHTGFEWNKYNQTHYDMDNPPPKIVQGYKFNIFYPDLIDKGSTPEYFLTPCPENKEFAILRFHAGPPYEDIAFKIVNREWEYSYKRGFRCQFHNNIFQLWFHFKRYRYRR
ncbi:hypothetical protein ILUMI_21940 [Ignelater luminosus]|uniref:Splicing factor Cactin n=1 Tax=Ignelater luminosus TaxID=2038154 RepID=A0A8K0G3E2_IGNLU|nr:hypothetical protein ILUMI_21940 [Ignelater luminosus]